MALYEFTLESLVKLDGGRVPETWNQALRRAMADCKDRPAVTEVRKVILQLELSPLMSEDGDMESVTASFQCKDTIPTRKTNKYSLAPRGDKLVFNDLSEDNVLQRTLDELEDED